MQFFKWILLLLIAAVAPSALAAMRSRANAASRAELRRLRAADTIGDDAHHRVDLEFDRGDLYSHVVMTRVSAA
ncbi:hypothetical protein BH09PSE6_BH09PSE6_09240 [soil metagenome]